jgi:hypothetical protein
MATILNRQVTFATNGTVTAAGLHNLIDQTEIYAGIITTQDQIASVGSSDQLLIADADETSTSAPRRVTVGSMFNDALNNGIYTTGSFTNKVTAGSFVGNLTGNVTGTIVGTTGTIATLNSTTSTITNLSATTSTFLGTITGSTNVINIGGGQIYKDGSGNVGIGVTPSGWGASEYKAIQVGIGGSISGRVAGGDQDKVNVAANVYHNGTNFRYMASDEATIYQQTGGIHIFSNAPSGTAGSTATFTERLRIASSGQFGIGGENYGTSGQVLTSRGNSAAPSWSESPVGFRNRIINGDMRIDQRSNGTAYAATTAGYGSCDRWGSLCGASGVWSQQRVATTLTDFPFAMRVQRTAGSTSTAVAYIGQVIETTNCADLAGKSVTLSFEAIAGANFSSSGSVITCAVYTGTGSDQGWTSLNSGSWSGFAASISVSQAITTTKTRYSFTGSIPAGTNEIAVRFDVAGTGTAGASDFFEITGVQLEAGSTATDFERRPISAELELCQRYYFKAQPTLNNRYGISRNISTTLSSLTVHFPIPMRTRPTALEQSGTANHYGIAYLATSAACSAVPTFAYSTELVSQVQFTNTAVLTAGQASEGYSANASGYLAWSAEL